MKLDNLLIFLFDLICCCFCTGPGNSTWQNDVISGRVDILDAKFKFWCNIDPVLCFLQEYKLLINAFI